MIPDLTPREIARFYSKVRIGGCGMLWDGPVNNHGYGRFEIYRDGGRVRVLAHRLTYMLATGIDPGSAKIRHGCDNPPCVTPDCLEPGTQADNIRDALERGRLDTAGLALPLAQRTAEVQERIASGKKICTRCKAAKAMADFHRNSRNADGRQSWCKTCRACKDACSQRRAPRRHDGKPVRGERAA
jgi:hypothetical protein